MIFIKIDGGGYSKEISDQLTLENLDFAILNFNILHNEFKLFIDTTTIIDDKINLYRGNYPITSINASDIIVTRVLSAIPLDKEVNGLVLNELKHEYIISFKQFNKTLDKNRLNHIYLVARNPIDYTYTKK